MIKTTTLYSPNNIVSLFLVTPICITAGTILEEAFPTGQERKGDSFPKMTPVPYGFGKYLC